MTPRKRWLGGKQQQVTWSSTGDVPQIDVLLYHGHYFLKTLCRNAPNIGSIAVRTPVGLTPGPYMLRVASNVNRHDVHASTPIEIDPDAVPPTISDVSVQQAEWVGGSQQNLTWTSQGDVPSINAQLYQGNAFVKSLCRNAPNTGAATVTVPNGLTPGPYTLRVASTAAESLILGLEVLQPERNVVNGTTAVSIDAGVVPPAISDVMVQQPQWHGGSSQQVSWSSQGSVPSVDLLLYRGGFFLKTLCRNASNTGSMSVGVPVGLTPGSHVLRVASNVNRHDVYGDAPIEIDPGGVPPAITDVSVPQNFVADAAVPCHAGSLQRVTWSSRGAVPSVHAQLFKDKFFVKTLFRNAPNTGSKEVTVPIGLTPGSYAIRVASSANTDAYAVSNPFAIDDEHRERCVHYALLLLGLPPQKALPYPIIRKIAVLAATD